MNRADPESSREIRRRVEESARPPLRRRHLNGLIRADGTPKLALDHFARHTPEMGIMQWFTIRILASTMRLRG